MGFKLFSGQIMRTRKDKFPEECLALVCILHETFARINCEIGQIDTWQRRKSRIIGSTLRSLITIHVAPFQYLRRGLNSYYACNQSLEHRPKCGIREVEESNFIVGSAIRVFYVDSIKMFTTLRYLFIVGMIKDNNTQNWESWGSEMAVRQKAVLVNVPINCIPPTLASW